MIDPQKDSLILKKFPFYEISEIGREDTLVLDSSISVKEAIEALAKWHKPPLNHSATFALMIDSTVNLFSILRSLSYHNMSTLTAKRAGIKRDIIRSLVDQ